MPWGALIGGAGSLLGGIFGSNAASDAAKTQAQSSQQALGFQQAVDQIIQQQLSPFRQVGSDAASNLAGLLGLPGVSGLSQGQPLSSLFSGVPGGSLLPPGGSILPPGGSVIPTGYQQSPGYGWQLQQGEQAIQDSAAGKTGALSGNTLKALQTYGTGLANQDYWNWFQNILSGNVQQVGANAQQVGANAQQFNANLAQRNALLSPLFNLASMGQGAAANLGTFGQASAGNTAGLLTGQGNALAAGQVGSSNALTGGINGLLTALLGGGGGGNNNLINYFLGQGGGSSWPYSQDTGLGSQLIGGGIA